MAMQNTNQVPFGQLNLALYKKCHKIIKVLEAVEYKIGGVMNSQSSYDLPRDQRQLYNIKNAEELKQESCIMAHGSSRTDTLAHVMNTYKQENGINAFIRSVEAAPDPMCRYCS